MLNAVEISNLTVKYPEVVALDDVSFVIEQGDFLGIIGPNGAGKSTLFDSMLGLNTTYTGTIKFFDQDIKKSKTYHKEIGYVPQKPEFENNFPAWPEIALQAIFQGAIASVGPVHQKANSRSTRTRDHGLLYRDDHTRDGKTNEKDRRITVSNVGENPH